MNSETNKLVEEHYARRDLGAVILGALADAGLDTDRLRPEDLAPIDEFHLRGRAATLDLARAAGIQPGMTVLDAGSGIGGPARCLAAEFGCRVTGVDLTAEYCRVATMLAERTGLADRVAFVQADATRLPFADGSFDRVWTAHVAMNIADKPRLYREFHRVLAPGGKLAIYDILAGTAGALHFPVPWAREAQSSFLASPDELRTLLADAGFEIESWADATQAARDWMAALAQAIRRDGPPKLGLHLLLGPDFRTMGHNQRRNVDEGRIVLAQVVAGRQPRKPGRSAREPAATIASEEPHAWTSGHSGSR